MIYQGTHYSLGPPGVTMYPCMRWSSTRSTCHVILRLLFSVISPSRGVMPGPRPPTRHTPRLYHALQYNIIHTRLKGDPLELALFLFGMVVVTGLFRPHVAHLLPRDWKFFHYNTCMYIIQTYTAKYPAYCKTIASIVVRVVENRIIHSWVYGVFWTTVPILKNGR